MRVTFQTVALAGVTAAALLACKTPTRAPPPDTTTPASAVSSTSQGRVFRVIADESLLQILTYRGGTLARVGHNHVIASRHLQGEVHIPDDVTRTRFDLTLPVALLSIDEPALRAAAGADFSSEVSESAKEGTRKNMLSEALLDSERFPGIRLTLTALVIGASGYLATIETVVKDQTHAHQVPLTLERSANEIIATGEFALKQSALGLKPFSVMLGALAVQDEMQVKFHIVARAG